MKHKLVYVEWEDIASTDSNWRTLDEALDWADETDSIVRQVGFLLSKDDEFLTLACSYIPDWLIGTTIRIPMSTVKHFQEIELNEEARTRG